MAESTTLDIVLLGKEEVTPGVAVALSPATDAIRITESTFTPDFSPLDNKVIKQTFGDLPAKIIKKAMKLEVKFFIRSGGGLGIIPDWMRILAVSNHNVVSTAGVKVVADPVTALGTSRKTGTFKYYEDGLAYDFVGAMADFKFDAPMDGYITGSATILAPYKPFTEAAAPTNCVFQQSDPIAVEASDVSTEGGTNIAVGSFGFESSADISERRMVGLEEVHMNGRPLPMVNISKASLGTLADYTRLLNGQLSTFTLKAGAAGNRFYFTASAGQVRSVKPTKDGIHNNRELGISCHESTSGGDDAYQLMMD